MVELSNVVAVHPSGRLTLPAATHERWRAEELTVVDMGDYILMRPMSADPVGSLVGKYAGRGPSSDEHRRMARLEDEEYEARRGGRPLPEG